MAHTFTAEALADMQKKVAEDLKEGVKTWDDFYDKLKDKMEQFSACQCPIHMSDAIYTNYAFIVALRELPEEGDIFVLIDRMAVIMTSEAKEKLFADLHPPGDDRPGRKVARAIIQSLIGGALAAPEGTETEGIDKSKLH